MTGGSTIRVCHVITGLGLGGAERSLAELVLRLRSHRIESAIVSLRSGGCIADSLRGLGFGVEEIGIDGPIPSIRAARSLVASIRGRAPDLLQGWMYHGNVAASVASRFLGRRIPLLWNIRTSIEPREGVRIAAPGIIPASRMLRRSPDLVIFNSRAGRRTHLAAGIRGRRSKVLPNGFDLDRFKPDESARAAVRARLGLADEVVFGCVARLDPLKGHRVLLEAFAKACRAMPDARLLLVGTGVDRGNPAFRELVPPELDYRTIIPVGPVDDVAPWLAAMDVVVMPSLVEGFPNALGEAMACGLPCIASDAGDARVMLGGHGEIVPAGAAAALAEALTRAHRLEPSRRRSIGLDARARIADRYSLERMAEAYASLYRRFADPASSCDSRHHA